MTKTVLLSLDGRGRVSLAKLGVKAHQTYIVEQGPGGRITLTPATVVADSELQLLYAETGTNATLAGMEWVVEDNPDGSLTVTPYNSDEI